MKRQPNSYIKGIRHIDKVGVIHTITSNPLAAGLIATTVGGGIFEYIRRRHQHRKEAQEWYGEAKGYLSNLQQASQKATAYRDGVNHDTLNELLDGLDEEMMMHANDSRMRVDDTARIELAIIAAYATGLASLTDKSSDTDALDFIKRVQTDAIKSYDGEYDMDDLESMFSGFDFGEFAKQDRDVSVNERAAEQFRLQFSDESLKAGYPATIEEALNIPIEEAKDAFENERFLNKVVDDSLEAFATIVLELGKDVHERMDARQERV